jgi:hypothetical protein
MHTAGIKRIECRQGSYYAYLLGDTSDPKKAQKAAKVWGGPLFKDATFCLVDASDTSMPVTRETVLALYDINAPKRSVEPKPIRMRAPVRVTRPPVDKVSVCQLPVKPAKAPLPPTVVVKPHRSDCGCGPCMQQRYPNGVPTAPVAPPPAPPCAIGFFEAAPQRNGGAL